jgi:hypothetical protein
MTLESDFLPTISTVLDDSVVFSEFYRPLNRLSEFLRVPKSDNSRALLLRVTLSSHLFDEKTETNLLKQQISVDTRRGTTRIDHPK